MLEGLLAIQSNWEDKASSNGNIWAYYKRRGEKSINGNVNDNNFSVFTTGKLRSIGITYNINNVKVLFIAPYKSISSLHDKSIISLDVTSGGLGVSVSIDNKVHVWETDGDTVRRCLEGHLFDVYTCRFFPSGLVILTGGADMQLKIWDAIKGCSPVALKGHTAAITDTAIVDRGKNIISVSKDGTARVWNCAKSECTDIILNANSEINCCSLLTERDVPSSTDSEIGENELLAVGCESGDVYIIRIHNKQTLALHRLICSVLCMCWLDESILAIGTSDGSVYVLDLQNVSAKPKLFCHDSCSPVLCMIPFRNGIIIGRRDGICQFYNEEGMSPVQFTGSDCDPVYAIAKDEAYIYTACRDASIRKYRMGDFVEFLPL